MIHTAHNETAIRAALVDWAASEGRDAIPASANALDRHDRRIFLKIRDTMKEVIEANSI